MSHPTDLELVDLVDGLLGDIERQEIRRHVSACARCAALVSELIPEEPLAHRRGVAPAGPESLVRGFASNPGIVARGGLWRLEWDGAAEVVLVAAANGPDADVAPVVVDPLVGDEYCRFVSAEDSPLGLTLVVWAGLARRIPMAAFAQQFGMLAADVTARALDTGAGAGLGDQADTAAHSAAAVRARLVMSLHRFNEARWDPPQRATEPFDLIGRLKDVGLKASELARSLGMAPVDITDIARHRRSFTPSQAVLAGEVLGVEPSLLADRPPLDPGLVVELQQPIWRAAISRRATAARTDEQAARMATADAVLTLAARTTGSKRGEPDWAQLVGDELGTT